jgi:F-type H+-transporting ATPase subunit delta
VAHKSEKVEKKYAEALFSLSTNENKEERLRILGEWVKLINDIPEMLDLINNPSFQEWDRNGLLCDTMQQFCPGDQIMMDFIMELAANRRLAELPAIVNDYRDLLRKERGITAVEVSSAFEITDEEKEELTNEMLQALGCAVEVNWLVKPEIIGGLVIKIGDSVIDNSLQGALARMQRDLLS